MNPTTSLKPIKSWSSTAMHWPQCSILSSAANQSFDLRLYLVIYPDLRGGKPEISLEILRNGQAVGRSQLPFKDEIRNTSREGGSMDSKTKGEQKHEFPYLAAILAASFDAGAYEAHVTIRQGRQTITRVVPFRVVDSK